MVIVKTGKRFGLSTQEVWFAGAHDRVPHASRTIFYQAETEPPVRAFQTDTFYTRAVNLLQTEDEIFEGINRTFKSHIRRAGKLDVTFRKLNLSHIPDLQAYRKSHAAFVKQKKIMQLPEWRLRALIEAQALMITVIEKDGVPVTYHAYVHDATRMRLLTSHTAKQTFFNEAEIGFCNKYHHWCDMLHGKAAGFSWYDFGGISKEDNNGRNYFKNSFGGEPQVFHHFITCTGLLKIWFALRKLV